LPPSLARSSSCELDASVGASGPRDFTSASAPFVRTKNSRAPPTRPSHPAPNVRDDREAPLLIERGTAGIMLLISGKSSPFPSIRTRPLRKVATDRQISHGSHARTARRARSNVRDNKKWAEPDRLPLAAFLQPHARRQPGKAALFPGRHCSLHPCRCATHTIDQRKGIVRRLIAPPGDMLIRS
jgi:hypothetical protein